MLGHPKPFKIHLYTLCWNERQILPHFFKYYSRFVSRFVVYDNYSDDGSREYIASQPLAELRSFDTCGIFREDIQIELRSFEWRESKGQADWVIICDMDEFIYHPQLIKYFIDCKNKDITMLHPFGYDMVADRFPTEDRHIHQQISKGVRNCNCDKKIVFNPNAIDMLKYGCGSHFIEIAKGRIKIERNPEVKLLHYKWLGEEYLLHRYALLRQRMSMQLFEKYGWNQHYLTAKQELQDTLKGRLQNAEKII